jgi:PHP family Zn ribbon phosphoesterase
MRRLRVDLHLHTVLSPCAEIEMIPPLIVQRALELGLGVIAVTDHHCAANVRAVIDAACHTDLAVLSGMEVQTREEVHMLCLFDTPEQADQWQDVVWAALPSIPNNAAFFGEQYVVDGTGEYLYTEDRMLATSTSLSVEQVVAAVNALGGICLPAHIDRPSYSLLSNLGFVPPGLPIAGVELSNLTTPQKTVQLFPQLAEYGMVMDGDAHRLAEMIAVTQVQIDAATVSELKLALAVQGGRSCEILVPSPSAAT